MQGLIAILWLALLLSLVFAFSRIVRFFIRDQSLLVSADGRNHEDGTIDGLCLVHGTTIAAGGTFYWDDCVQRLSWSQPTSEDAECDTTWQYCSYADQILGRVSDWTGDGIDEVIIGTYASTYYENSSSPYYGNSSDEHDVATYEIIFGGL